MEVRNIKLSGWGRFPIIKSQPRSFEKPEQLEEVLSRPGDLIVHALGRSYGDSALNSRVILTRRFNKIWSFDPENGLVVCESGVTLKDLIETFLPRGWLPEVMPGTKYITVGGAVASDVHGKNHHRVGCFSESVLSLELLLPEGQEVRCSRQENPPLFHATCGGMGLTGIILQVELRLRRVQSAYIQESLVSCRDLEEVMARFEEHHHAAYSVAWIDCLAQNRRQGRGILMLGEPGENGPLNVSAALPRTIPVNLPGWWMNRCTISLFNHFFYQGKSAVAASRMVHLDDFFFPLDKIGHWNRLYGRAGLTQYQLVLPKTAGRAGLKEILKKVSSGPGSLLAVLKLFGPANANYLSFPLEGYTLALDFKIQPRLFPFLEELDRVVLDHGGRLYLAKDVRMPGEVFTKSYRDWPRFAAVRRQYGLQEKFNSLQSKRLGL